MINLKTKPFNLEEALAGKPVVTRDGQQVKKITRFDVNQTNPYSVYGLVGDIIGNWTESGKYVAGTPSENPLDLFIETEAICIWVNVRKKRDRLFVEHYYLEEEAVENARDTSGFTFIKTIKITDDK